MFLRSATNWASLMKLKEPAKRSMPAAAGFEVRARHSGELIGALRGAHEHAAAREEAHRLAAIRSRPGDVRVQPCLVVEVGHAVGANGDRDERHCSEQAGEDD